MNLKESGESIQKRVEGGRGRGQYCNYNLKNKQANKIILKTKREKKGTCDSGVRVSYNPGSPQTYYLAKASVELLIFLLPPHKGS